MSEEITMERNPIDSIEVSKNAKGEYAWKAKLYFDNQWSPYEDIVDDLEKINAMLEKKFG